MTKNRGKSSEKLQQKIFVNFRDFPRFFVNFSAIFAFLHEPGPGPRDLEKHAQVARGLVRSVGRSGPGAPDLCFSS